MHSCRPPNVYAIALVRVTQEVSSLHVGWLMGATPSQRDDMVDSRAQWMWCLRIAYQWLPADLARPRVTLKDGEANDWRPDQGTTLQCSSLGIRPMVGLDRGRQTGRALRRARQRRVPTAATALEWCVADHTVTREGRHGRICNPRPTSLHLVLASGRATRAVAAYLRERHATRETWAQADGPSSPPLGRSTGQAECPSIGSLERSATVPTDQ